MALVRPVTRTIISTATFGHPVHDIISAQPWQTVTYSNGWSAFTTPRGIRWRYEGIDTCRVEGVMKGGTLNVVAFSGLPTAVAGGQMEWPTNAGGAFGSIASFGSGAFGVTIGANVTYVYASFTYACVARTV